MAARRSNQRRDGRYVFGGVVEQKGTRLGWWERKPMPKSHSDVPYTISKQHAGRPDLLAYDVYGRANLMWVILQYNSITDINLEFVEGTEILLPTVQRLFGELLISTTI
jgi:hypothetical protein